MNTKTMEQIKDHFDREKIDVLMADLKSYCSLINEAAGKLTEAGITERLTDTICWQFVRQDFTPLLSGLTAEQQDHADAVFEEFKQQANEQCPDVELWERVPFIKCVDGAATFDRGKVTADCRYLNNSSVPPEFIEHVRRVYSVIVAFDNDCKVAGGNGVGRRFALIEPDNMGGLRLNWEALKTMHV